MYVSSHGEDSIDGPKKNLLVPTITTGLGDRAIRLLSTALSAGACKKMRELEIGDNR